MRAREHLRSLDPPCVFLVTLPLGHDARTTLASPAGFITRIADGRRCRTKAALLSELSTALAFPENAPNWDALEEQLADLEWLPATGYIVGLDHAEDLLSESPGEREVFFSILETVGKEWASPRGGEWPRPAIPFHVCLIALEGGERTPRDWGVPILEP